MHVDAPAAQLHRRAWSRTGAAIAAFLCAVGVLSAGLVGSALPAYADVTTGTYTIGTVTGPVGNVVVTPSTATVSTPTNFELSFVATAALSASGTIAIEDSTAQNSVVFTTSKVQLVDSAATCLEPSPNYATSSRTGLTVTMGSSCAIGSGDTVEVDFTATAPAPLGPLTFSVTTSGNSSAASSNPVTVNPALPTVSVGSAVAGASPLYSFSGVPVVGLSSSGTSLVLVAKATGGDGTVVWYNGAAGYTVAYAPSGGSATTADTVSAATVSTTVNPGDTVTLTLADPLANGYTLYITAEGTNPAGGSTDIFTVTPGNGTPETTTNDLTYGSTISNVLVAVSPSVAGVPATYSVSFKATTAAPVGDDIFLSEPNTDFSQVTGILVTDANQGWHFVAVGAALSSGGATVPLSYAISSGDAVTVELVNVINPPAGTITDFAVSTTTEIVAVDAAPYSVTASGGPGVSVHVDPATPAVTATYTISNLSASAALTGGTSTITLVAPEGTVFPENSAFFTVEDSTSPSGSGTVTALVGGGTNAVSLTVPNDIKSGDDLTLTAQDVINPGAAGNYTISVTGNVTVLPGPPPFPHANLTYPDGAIVSFFGTLYVFAGSHSFGVASPAVAVDVEAADHASVVTAAAGANIPTAPAVPGTLVIVYNNPTIYVVGTDGELHGFATPAQFLGDGYDPADVITVPNRGRLTVGATAGSEGASLNALATGSNGAIVDSSGTFYVLAGGRAFGIWNPAVLRAIEATDTARPLLGIVGPDLTGATIADGTLVTVSGEVYVSYGGDLYPFKSLAQLTADGYGGTPSIPLPSTGGLTVELPYSGS